MPDRVPSWLTMALLALAWPLPLVLLHELGHGLAALALTDGEVKISMRGWCTYEPDRLRRRHGELMIVAAVTLVVAVVLSWAALETTSVWYPRGDFATRVLDVGAFCAVGQLLLTALPLRYGPMLGPSGGESDGRAIWRVLTGAPPRRPGARSS